MHDFDHLHHRGLATASNYAITLSGLTLTYTTTGIFNWSRGMQAPVAQVTLSSHNPDHSPCFALLRAEPNKFASSAAP